LAHHKAVFHITYFENNINDRDLKSCFFDEPDDLPDFCSIDINGTFRMNLCLALAPVVMNGFDYFPPDKVLK